MMDGATGYEVMLAKLQQDQFRLKQVQSQEGKAKLKTEMLPDYVPYVDGVLGWSGCPGRRDHHHHGLAFRCQRLCWRIAGR